MSSVPGRDIWARTAAASHSAFISVSIPASESGVESPPIGAIVP